MTPSVNPLLMGCSVEQLRAKLTSGHGELGCWWQHFLTLARQDSQWFSPYTVLAAVVTEEEADRQRARRALLRFVELADEGYTSLDAQVHTHVVTAPLGRWAIYYDWLADAELFTPAEDAAIRAAMLDYAHVFALQNIKSRARSFENQVFSSAFCAAAVGYVFGIKRGDDALGRRLYSEGIAWVQELLRLLPPGGYNPEGSAYHEFVVLPLVTLAAKLVEETTGRDMMSSDAHGQGGVLQLLQTSHRMIGPAGLMPAWDAYGFQPAAVKSGMALLAKLTGDPAPLATIRGLGLWYRASLVAWEVDDRLWTLVWWPEQAALNSASTMAPQFPAWMEPQVGGALQDAARKLRLFQYWDECGGLPSSGRCQVDPNAITLEAFGSPLLLDGNGRPGADIIPMGADARTFAGERTLETVKEYGRVWGELTDEQALRTAFDGSAGMSNCLVIDDEAWYVPGSPRHGVGEALHKAGALEVLRSDATAFYADRYGAQQVTRTSLLVGGEYLLVSDTVRFDAPHALTWQAYLRNEAVLDGNRISQRTPEQVGCELVFLTPGQTTVTAVDGYPAQLEGKSTLVRHRADAATNHRVDVALVPQSLLEPVQDLTDGWERGIGERWNIVSLDSAYLTDPFEPADAPRVFRRAVKVTDAEARTFFTLCIANPETRLEVNGRAVLPALHQTSNSNWKTGGMQTWIFDVTAALVPGENEFCLTAPFFHGEAVCGPAWLQREKSAHSVTVVPEGPDSFVVSIGERTDRVLVERRGGAAAWAGGTTDARYAVLRGDGGVCVVEATSLDLPESLKLESQASCDFAWNHAELDLARLTDGTWVEANWEGNYLRVAAAGCLTITYRGKNNYRLLTTLASPRTVVVNGKVVHPAEDSLKLSLELPGELGGTWKVPTTSAEVYELAEREGPASEVLLIEALTSEDWRISMAAADVIGSLGITSAVPYLLTLFCNEPLAEAYPKLTMWWRGSKMLRDPSWVEGVDPSIEIPLGVKRWRVKRAAVTALGKLGSPLAVAPLEAALRSGEEFFPIESQLAVALGRLGAQSSIPVLQRCLNHAEVNTRAHARLALSHLCGEISREEFEARVGL